jgi:hypothetical protein
MDVVVHAYDVNRAALLPLPFDLLTWKSRADAAHADSRGVQNA